MREGLRGVHVGDGYRCATRPPVGPTAPHSARLRPITASTPSADSPVDPEMPVTTSWYQDDRVWIGNADCREVLAELQTDSIHAVVTDPPYEIGFMGKAHDKSGVAYDVDMWREVLRVLKPGGHLLAFGGTRTYHRMAVAVEDAGFEIRDSVMWIHGQGWPKSKHQLKPAHEPIVMARKPFTGSLVSNLLGHGTGAINVDGCRIAGTVPKTVQGQAASQGTSTVPTNGTYASSSPMPVDDGPPTWCSTRLLPRR